MFDVNMVTEKNYFKYWFVRRGVSNVFDVHYNCDVTQNIGYIVDSATPTFTCTKTEKERVEGLAEFKEFKQNRPEYMVGMKFSEEDIRASGTILFDRIVTGVFLMQHGDDGMRRAESCLKWLHSTDFYTAPASTQYHDCEPGGLHMHTLRVVNKIIDLYNVPDFAEHVKVYEAIVVAIVHDWCKINFYEPYKRNVKNEVTGAWEQVQSYRYGKPKIPMGHGETSLYVAQKFFKLSLDQALAIRWHMGDPGNSESYNFWDANEKYPIVNMLQFADRLSIVNY